MNTDKSLSNNQLSRIECQNALFSDNPKRADITNIKKFQDLKTIRINVQRTRPFEFVASIMTPYLNYGGFEPLITYSDYDDTLSFLNSDAEADLEVLWLDFARYTKTMDNRECVNWLFSRINQLRQRTNVPIVLLDWDLGTARAKEFNQLLADRVDNIEGAFLISHDAIMDKLGEGYRDARAARITGMDLSNNACVELGKLLGSVWIPSLMGLRIKAIVLDLDNTLYSGVLGEDGADGIKLTDGHIKLHEYIKQLRERGLFLAVCSRNEKDDVVAMFNWRSDFPLQLADFSESAVNWSPKSQNIVEIADKLRIGLDSILFVDDNPGELLEVSSALIGIHFIHAKNNAEDTLRALESYPGLFRPKISIEDQLRVDDLQKSQIREKLLAENSSVEDYLSSLGVSLEFRLNPDIHLGRLSELSQKTNQFNTTLSRLLETDVSEYLFDEHKHVVSVHLRDRLSDSGIIAAIFLRNDNYSLVVDEMAVSCRALGRQIETIAIWESIRRVTDEVDTNQVAFCFNEGPRNNPAKSWVEANTELANGKFSEGKYVIPWSEKTREAVLPELPIEISWVD